MTISDVILAVLLTAVLAMQGWVLTEIVALKVKLAEILMQQGRFISDRESEKTRQSETNGDVERRLRILEGRA
jgi:hypothetical protein